MNEDNCTGKCSECSGCNGCSERVILSCDPKVSFVSTITFSSRNFGDCSAIRLVIDCAKRDANGECYAGVAYFKDGKETGCEPMKYKIDNRDLTCLNLDFESKPDADKAEVKVFCQNGATLLIEHINLINIRKA